MIFGIKYRFDQIYLVLVEPKCTIYLIGVISQITKTIVIATLHKREFNNNKSQRQVFLF